jgi:hypothetical protein
MTDFFLFGIMIFLGLITLALGHIADTLRNKNREGKNGSRNSE